jgi:hypothetical protein
MFTVPVGDPAPGAVTVTVAVNVTLWPKTDGLVEEATVVAVFALFTTMLVVPVLVLWAVSGLYLADTEAVPAVEAVNVEVQVADAVVEAPRVHVVNDPVTPVWDSVTVPVAVRNVPVPVSVTVTLQVEPWPTTTGVVQATVVVVGRTVKVKVTVVELFGAPVAVEVTVAVSVCGVLDAHVNVDVKLVPRVPLVGFKRHVAEPVTVTPRFTVPVKPPLDATVMVEVPPDGPTFAVTEVGLALRLTPPETGTVTVTETTVEFVIRLFVPPAPLIVKVNVVVVAGFAETVHLDCTLPPIGTVTGESHVASKPVGETDVVTATEPANWKVGAPRLVIVALTKWVCPAGNDIALPVALFVMLKPLIRIVKVPSVLAASPVAVIVSLYSILPYKGVVVVKLIGMTRVCPAANVKVAGRGGQT